MPDIRLTGMSLHANIAMAPVAAAAVMGTGSYITTLLMNTALVLRVVEVDGVSIATAQER